MNISFTISHLPGRKKPYLLLTNDKGSYILGTFRNEEMADLFKKAFFDTIDYFTVHREDDNK